MHYVLEPNLGAGALKFSKNRDEIRRLFLSVPITKTREPENDFYEKEGLILGYDESDELEYIEIIEPSTAEYRSINFFSLSLNDCLNQLYKCGLKEPYDDGGYNFPAVGIVLYCPQGDIESVSLYRKGYYDDL